MEASAGQAVRRERLFHDEEQTVRDFFGDMPSGTPVAIEAGAGWMWLADLLEDLELDVHLAHPGGVRLIAQSKLKTDKVDAAALAQLLRTGFLPESYFAAGEVRDQRMVLRHRERMVKWRTMLKNAVHAVLARHNVHLSATDIFGAGGMEMLRTLDLPQPSRWVLDQLLESIEYLNKRIERARAKIARMLQPDERVDWLTSIPGIGKLTAYYVVAEIGQIDRFPSASQFVSYAGLCPSTHQSGSKLRHGRTSPGGRRLLKWVLVEATHTAVRRDHYFGTKFRHLQRTKGNGKAYIAVARKMARIVWQLLKEHRPYETRTQKPPAGSTQAMAAR
jgi:transposase